VSARPFFLLVASLLGALGQLLRPGAAEAWCRCRGGVAVELGPRLPAAVELDQLGVGAGIEVLPDPLSRQGAQRLGDLDVEVAMTFTRV